MFNRCWQVLPWLPQNRLCPGACTPSACSLESSLFNHALCSEVTVLNRITRLTSRVPGQNSLTQLPFLPFLLVLICLPPPWGPSQQPLTFSQKLPIPGQLDLRHPKANSPIVGRSYIYTRPWEGDQAQAWESSPPYSTGLLLQTSG